MKKIKMLALLLCLVLMVGLLAGCSDDNGGLNRPSSSSEPNTKALSGRAPMAAASYADVFKALSNTAAGNNDPIFGSAQATDSGGIVKREALSGAVAPVPAAENGSTSSGAQDDGYSQTNVQVGGVDEGDIVKTDGIYIYVLRQNELIIFKADGASTTRISSVKIGSDKPVSGYGGKTPESIGNSSEYASDIYITGNTAVIISSYSSYMPYIAEDAPVKESAEASESIAKPGYAPMNNQQIAKLYIFDITDRSNPVKKAELGQDGYVLTTRLIDNMLYMISSYYVYSSVEGNSETYIPRLYTDGTAKLVSPGRISIMPYFNSTSYIVICAYDLTSASLSSNQSILGGGSTVYMNEETLFIANSTSNQTVSDPYKDSIYTVTDYTMTNVTDITSFDIAGGKLALKASGSVPGNLNSQFALDEYNGNLRVVTTTYNQMWSEYSDKDKGFVNYIYKDPSSANALFVLDGSLKIIGSVTDLAKDEQVYSVRFDGAIGYFVTFRRVDPLFAVDLSDPANPSVLSALKIPGFSEYLHVYGEGRLFGLGMDADVETGRTNGMKLTMFDTADPKNVTVKNELKLNTQYSNALYNHKAILISADKGIIAFPADNGYDIYNYSDAQGFIKKATIPGIDWYGDSRGLYIGDLAYIVDNTSISVLDMSSFTLLNRISY